MKRRMPTRPYYMGKPTVMLGVVRECLRCHKLFDVPSEHNPFQFCPACRPGEAERDDCPSCDRTDRQPGRSECEWCAKLRRIAKKTAVTKRLRTLPEADTTLNEKVVDIEQVLTRLELKEFNATTHAAREAIRYDEHHADTTFEVDGVDAVEMYSSEMHSIIAVDDADATPTAPLAIVSGGWFNYDPKALYRVMNKRNERPTEPVVKDNPFRNSG